MSSDAAKREVRVNIFIMRHGQAAPEALNDESRPLTTDGKAEVQLMAQWLAPHVPQFERVLVSPYLRAQQTWQQLSEHLSTQQVDTCAEFTPDAEVALAVSLLLAYKDVGQSGNILLISHMPMVGYLVESLCPGQAPPSFPTAGLARISFTDSQVGQLDWLEAPHTLT